MNSLPPHNIHTLLIFKHISLLYTHTNCKYSIINKINKKILAREYLYFVKILYYIISFPAMVAQPSYN